MTKASGVLHNIIKYAIYFYSRYISIPFYKEQQQKLTNIKNYKKKSFELANILIILFVTYFMIFVINNEEENMFLKIYLLYSEFVVFNV